MKNLKFIAAICLIMIASAVNAGLSPMQIKEARMAVYLWIDSYYEYSSFATSGVSARSYLSLFDGEEVPVVDDYLPTTIDTNITISDYVNAFTRTTNEYSVHQKINDIYLIKEFVNNDIYYCTIGMKKEICFVAKKDTIYKYPSKTYDFSISLKYIKETRNIVCTGITTSDSLKVDVVWHSPLQEPVNEYIFIRDIPKLLQNTENNPVIVYKSICHPLRDEKFMALRYDTLKNSVCFGMNLGTSWMSSSFSGDLYDVQKKPGVAFGFWAGYYRQLYLKQNHRIGLELSLSYSCQASSIDGNYYHTHAAIDPDEGSYERQIMLSQYSEKLTRHALQIPITFRYDYFFKPNYSFFTRLGVSVSFDVAQQSTATANALYAGYYDWLFNVTMNQNGIYDFGSYNLDNRATQLGLNKFGISAVIGCGVQIFIPQSKWAIEPSLLYSAVIYNPIVQNENFVISEKDGDYHSATNLLKSYMGHNFCLQVLFIRNF